MTALYRSRSACGTRIGRPEAAMVPSVSPVDTHELQGTHNIILGVVIVGGRFEVSRKQLLTDPKKGAAIVGGTW